MTSTTDNQCGPESYTNYDISSNVINNHIHNHHNTQCLASSRLDGPFPTNPLSMIHISSDSPFKVIQT